TTAGARARKPASVAAAFRHRLFVVVWTATLVADVGSWMYGAAAGWLMTSLDPDPLRVALVQTASTLPVFLLAIPAGALADIFDIRKYLIVVEIVTTALAALYAAIVAFNLATPDNLLLFAFLIGASGALAVPAWQSVVPQLVPREDLTSAVAANGLETNASRALGPALGGAAIAGLGIVSPFWINAVSNLAVIGALTWWRRPAASTSVLPTERFTGAVRAGLRYAANSPALRATLMRAIGFFLCASAYWALLPLVARTQIMSGPGLYGILLGAIGLGAVAGAVVMPRLREKLGPDMVMTAGLIGTAIALVLYGLAHDAVTALIASLLAGVSWIAVLAVLTVSAQVSLPDWVRGRGLALFTTVFFGGVTLGSTAWGKLAAVAGLPAAHFFAAAGALVAIPLTWRWKLQAGAGVDLTPSMHWPTPLVAQAIEEDRGPVLVTVEYRIRPEDRANFLAALAALGRERRRDGAYRWGAFEDAADQARIVEAFLVASWTEHLRQHERVTNADRLVQERVDRFQLTDAPKITHFLSVEP
ncbi:MAG TPA: MFS transporter, partial [Xanthobacteraceae bacterium]|nr:MFS transporter [Xanthobacteraceae bacterium]